MKFYILLPILLPLAAGRTLLKSRALDTTSITPRQSTSTNALLALVASLFPVNVVVQDLGDVITTAESAFAAATGVQTTENDLENAGACGDVLIIFARGTMEPGDVGSLVGPPFFNAVRASLPSGKTLAVQGVDDYAAGVPGFLQGGDAAGSQRMAALVTQAATQCPKSKVVMSGYSQGGQLVHNAAKLLPASTMAAVSSIVIFGDPDNGEAIQGASGSKVLTICHDGDDICDHSDLILLPHLTYLADADTAAQFVLTRAGLQAP